MRLTSNGTTCSACPAIRARKRARVERTERSHEKRLPARNVGDVDDLRPIRRDVEWPRIGAEQLVGRERNRRACGRAGDQRTVGSKEPAPQRKPTDDHEGDHERDDGIP